MLVDTNVLVAAFCPEENQAMSDYAKYAIHDLGRPILIPTAVIVESWGFIVGKLKNKMAGRELFEWLNLPGRATILPPHQSEVVSTQELIGQFGIDCVDAMLAELATNITEFGNLKPAMSIATFDTGDFTRMFSQASLKFSLYDMHTREDIFV